MPTFGTNGDSLRVECNVNHLVYNLSTLRPNRSYSTDAITVACRALNVFNQTSISLSLTYANPPPPKT